jgi:outer membrane protein TolC
MFRNITLISLMILLTGTAGWSEEPAPSKALSLTVAIRTALQNNASVRAAENHEKSTEAAMKSSRSDFLPKASATYSYTHLQDAPYQMIPGVGPQTVGDTDNYHWDVTVVQPLFTGFGIWSKYKISKADSEIGSLEKERTRDDVVRDVKTAYYQALLAKRIEKVAEENVATLESQARDSKSFFDHGIIPKNDYLKSKIALAAAVQDLEKAKADSKIAEAALNIVMGSPINEPVTLEPQNITITDCGELNDLIAEAVKRRPELRIMDQGLEKYDRSVTLSRSSYYPEISLVGRYEQNGNNAGATENDFTNDHNTSVSVQAKWTFFEWGKRVYDVSGTRYERSSFSEKRKGTEDQVRLETKQEYLNVKVSEKNIATAEEALDQARENFRITKVQYMQHVTTSTEVLDAQTYLSRAESNYYKALYGYMIARARLDRATGRTVTQ